jgi:predicted TIM-barrel fold metal-dependent hydrolase
MAADSPPAIDTHLHVVSADRDRYPTSSVIGAVSPWVLTAEDLVAAMDVAGMSTGVVVQASTVYGYDNSYTADALAEFPERLIGVCAIDPAAGDRREQIDHWVGDRGFSGLRLFPAGAADPAIVGEQWLPVWRSAHEHQASIVVQMSLDLVPQLAALLGRFPDVPVVLDHMALSGIDEGFTPYDLGPLLSLATYPNVFLKLTTTNFIGLQGRGRLSRPLLERVIGDFGSDHVMWGSNIPAASGTIAELLGLAERELSFLSAEERTTVFVETARSVYPLATVHSTNDH